MDPVKSSLKLLKYLPRFSEKNLVDNIYKKPTYKLARGSRRVRWPTKSNEMRQRWHPLGYERGNCPWQMRVPAEKYYDLYDTRRQYPPYSLRQLQMAIDFRLIDTSKPIDLATLCNANHFEIITTNNHYGVHLTSEGIDDFNACINIEVQHIREPVIAAIERNGGRVTSTYYDIKSVAALADPYKFFKTGEPIPKRLLPPPNAIDYYTDPKNRGYLADPKEIEAERFKLAQKYGYDIPEIEDPKQREMLLQKKHVKQVFFGLEAGMVVNLKDREILEPTDPELREFYGLKPIDEPRSQEASQ